MKITSREYKVMLDHRMFLERKSAVKALQSDLARAAKRAGVVLKGNFNDKKKRTIEFLDTADATFKKNRLVLRRRIEAEKERAEFTLKLRNEDRYIAQGLKLRRASGFDGDEKFEEDIAAPCRSRFSHSVSLALNVDEATLPQTVGEAAALFPVLGRLKRDGGTCDRRTPVRVVGGFVAHERVLTGAFFELPGDVEAEAALILWSHAWDERAIAVEFSFRYKDEHERFAYAVADAAFTLFLKVQELDWCLPEGTTKTQFVYGDEA